MSAQIKTAKPAPDSGPFAAPGSGSAEYVELRRLVTAQVELGPQPRYYTLKIVFHLGLLMLGLGLLFLQPGPVALFAIALLLALASGQLGVLGHDAGHNQLFKSRRLNEMAGLLLFSTLNGVTFSFWVQKHNQHHAFPNQLTADPDIDMRVHAYCPEMLQQTRGIYRFLVRYQAVLFFPLLLFQVFNLRWDSLLYLARHRGQRLWRTECLLLAVHHLIYLGTLFFALGVVWGLVFYCLFQALLGAYVGTLFAVNHLGMPILPKDTQLGFLRRQVLTSRGLRTHPVTGYIFAGLGYQIEHHLFPHASANHLEAIRRLVQPFCEARGIPYRIAGPVQAVDEVLRSLHAASAPLRGR